MKFVLAYILSIFFYTAFFLLLVIFQPIQFIAWHIFGKEAHKKVVDILNYGLIKITIIIGIKSSYNGMRKFPKNRPLIVISNHQGTYDIPPIMWIFREHYPKFVSKKELGKNIPSISYNLRKSGAALIDRDNHMQSVREILKLGKLIAKNNYTACIFPEGTRSKTGIIKEFKTAGIEALLRAAPNALIIPLAIDGNYKIEQNGMFPLNIGQHVSYNILEPIEPANLSAKEVTAIAEKVIREKLHQLSAQKK